MKQIWTQLTALWLALRDPRTPRAAKWVAALTLTYALSPIDLIPDFIPVLGMLDDVILIPLGVALAIKLVPAALWTELVKEAEAKPMRLPKSRWGLALVVLVWLAVLAGLVWWWLK